jgi:hypothetical protein
VVNTTIFTPPFRSKKSLLFISYHLEFLGETRLAIGTQNPEENRFGTLKPGCKTRRKTVSA